MYSSPLRPLTPRGRELGRLLWVGRGEEWLLGWRGLLLLTTTFTCQGKRERDRERERGKRLINSNKLRQQFTLHKQWPRIVFLVMIQ
jgi:hypothetical protein